MKDIRVASVQFNHHANDKAYNLAVIEKYVSRSLENGVEMIVFPEMCITGYPPQDLLWKKDFITKSYQSLEKLSKNRTGKDEENSQRP